MLPFFYDFYHAFIARIILVCKLRKSHMNFFHESLFINSFFTYQGKYICVDDYKLFSRQKERIQIELFIRKLPIFL